MEMVAILERSMHQLLIILGKQCLNLHSGGMPEIFALANKRIE
jgi:hypothetical protein